MNKSIGPAVFRNLFTFVLDELKTIRVRCKHKDNGKECGGIVEVPIARLGSLGKCPLCKEAFQRDGDQFERFQRLFIGHRPSHVSRRNRPDSRSSSCCP